MIPVGRFVLESACADLERWQGLIAGRELRVNVNLSVQEVLQPDLPDYLRELIAKHRINPSQISLEITETSILQSEARAAGVLAQLKAVGVELCIDDFGTGYSSLRYIKSLPIDGFKIDQTFISELEDVKSQQIVEMLVRLGEACGLDVTAEGIESAAQAARLLALGCAYGQGTHFHTAMPPEMVTTLLR